MVLNKTPTPTAPPRDRLLHNFPLSPSLNWGIQLCLRPIIPGDPRRSTVYHSLPERLHRIPPLVINEGDTDETIRARLRLHLRSLALAEKEEDDDSAAGPWNLRKRKVFCDSPPGPIPRAEEEKAKPGSCESPLKLKVRPRSLRLRGLAPDECAEGKPRRREAMSKLSIPLTKSEIEEDFLLMTGSKTPRRPKKRAKTVQNNLDELFPGMLLSDVTPEMYQVNDFDKP